MLKHLMIHQWNDDYYKIKLDNYILSFDDGLYSQVPAIIKICKLYPNIKIMYYVSTGIINLDSDNRNYERCDIAHKNFFENGDTSNYVSNDDLILLSKLKQVTIGLHGHKHLRLEHLKQNNHLNGYFKIIIEDVKQMLFSYISMYQNKIVKQGEIYFCTPYNYSCDLYNALFRKKFNDYFPEVSIDIVGPEREDIDQVLKLI